MRMWYFFRKTVSWDYSRLTLIKVKIKEHNSETTTKIYNLAFIVIIWTTIFKASLPPKGVLVLNTVP